MFQSFLENKRQSFLENNMTKNEIILSLRTLQMTQTKTKVKPLQIDFRIQKKKKKNEAPTLKKENSKTKLASGKCEFK